MHFSSLVPITFRIKLFVYGYLNTLYCILSGFSVEVILIPTGLAKLFDNINY